MSNSYNRHRNFINIAGPSFDKGRSAEGHLGSSYHNDLESELTGVAAVEFSPSFPSNYFDIAPL